MENQDGQLLNRHDRTLFQSIERGPYVPTTEIPAIPVTDQSLVVPASLAPKSESHWSQEDKELVATDERAKSLLIMALPNYIFSQVDACASAKEIWDQLENLCEGGEMMKMNKRTNCVSLYERFKSLPNEKLCETYYRFAKLLNKLKKFGIVKSNDERNIKFLDALPREWRSLTMTLSSTLEPGNMSLHDLYSILVPREEEIYKESNETGGSLALISNSQRTPICDPQTSNCQNIENSDTSSDFSAFAEAIALLTKTFKQRLRGGGQRYQKSDKGRMEGRSRDKEKAEVMCYKCKQKGHYASECKNKKLKDVAYYEKKLEEDKKQQKVSLIAGTDTWLSDDSSDEEEEMANFCLMALFGEQPETSEQKINLDNLDLEHKLNKLMSGFLNL
ncbi:uncharacterized protein LOC110923883 [Helianthus annuus]|uniref:uncharacterized protein LOC110923883 n=1 Tax=Helianthus annuus TaxID=4232 RepID=UPI000B8FFAA4|nr:uncharacterized protein LOC110923883 [Helianthus annuus]